MIDKEVIGKIKKEQGCDIFFETGFYKGQSVQAALELGFEKVYSIELLKEFYDAGCQKFKSEISEGRVNLIADDSANLHRYLGDIVNRKVMFWFDAHHDNGGTPVTDMKSSCPLLDEISALSLFDIKPVILVDDIRVIRGDSTQMWGPQAWGEKSVNVQAIIEKIKRLPFDYSMYYVDGSHPTIPMPEDILVAV